MFVALAAALLPGGCKPKAVQVEGLPWAGREVPAIRVLLMGGPVERVFIIAPGGCRIAADGQTILETSRPFGPAVIRRIGRSWQLGNRVLAAKCLVVTPMAQAVTLGSKAYRGELHLYARDRKFIVVNHLDVESYLAGVLAKELYPNWHVEAYRAQAVAARTFAMYHMLTSGPGRDYDLGDMIASQVYGGLSGETAKARRAAWDTFGQLLTVAQEGEQRVFMAQYSSSCGGWVNPAEVLRDGADFEPLRGGQQCLHCTASRRYRWGTVRVAKDEICRVLQKRSPPVRAIGGLAEIRVVSQLPHGRPVWLDLIGTNGRSMPIRAEKIRLALLFGGSAAGKTLYSMNCSIVDTGRWVEFRQGRGFGHGVGMCQFGTQGKALTGWKAGKILEFYYPGAKIVRAY
ncbi:MAG: SpoIID/LytB domain-containing protein [Phycisphaerae bacterium]|jgi:stage II sporulation protein D|nr:SpoIID/LytB domain-containing protein [Phycisphaerae bacterium]